MDAPKQSSTYRRRIGSGVRPCKKLNSVCFCKPPLPPGAFHGIDDRIFAHLQLRILAQKRHILLVAFEPRDAVFD